MNPLFSVAITTYNRPESVIRLVNQIQLSEQVPEEILVVDSSDGRNEALASLTNVVYIQSSHKNQPYQRYLAYLCCKTDVIIFLDDDLEISDSTVFTVMLNRLTNQDTRGVSVGFHHHRSISELVDSKVDGKSFLFRLVNFISGVPKLESGKIYMAGLAGPRPNQEGQVDYFNGAVMGFYKQELDHLFDPTLFSLFERKLGMGEDKVISMAVGLKKKLWYVPASFFNHPPLASNYFQNVLSFQSKVMYSRLFVSLRYGKLKGRPELLIYLHYYYFASWRILISIARWLIRPSDQNKNLAKGTLQGTLLTFTLPFQSGKITPEINWKTDAERDTTGFK